MKNKCTLIIDGNWLLQSRMAVMINEFSTTVPESQRRCSQDELQNRLAYSIIKMLNRFPCIDNIILVTDGGSWRKKLPVPTSIQSTVYKGNRTKSEEIGWSNIFNALNNLTKHCQEIGITTSQFIDVEGDDWCWYWSRRLNDEGTHCIIWSIDNDLKQLIQVFGGAFTAWYNDRNGLYLHKSLEEQPIDDVDFFLTSKPESPILEELKRKSGKVTYIDPSDIILDKIICGDNSDNIKPVVRYVKNGRNRRMSEKEWLTLANQLNIKNIIDFKKKEKDVINYIINKYHQLNLKYDTLHEHIEYNMRLVWLDQSQIPETVQAKMCELEYKLFDLSQIRNNANMLSGLHPENQIEQIFENIDVPF